jgi:hypothetical protein
MTHVWLLVTTVFDDRDVSVTAWATREAAVACVLADDDPVKPEFTERDDGGCTWHGDAWTTELRREPVRGPRQSPAIPVEVYR